MPNKTGHDHFASDPCYYGCPGHVDKRSVGQRLIDMQIAQGTYPPKQRIPETKMIQMAQLAVCDLCKHLFVDGDIIDIRTRAVVHLTKSGMMFSEERYAVCEDHK